MNTAILNAQAPRVLAILRIVTALIFLLHGTQKLFGVPTANFSPAAFSLPWIAGVIEIVGGLLLIVGLFVRPAAFIMSGTMAFAYWMAHAPRNLFPTLNGGDAAILYCFIFLYLVFAGGGAWALDNRK